MRVDVHTYMRYVLYLATTNVECGMGGGPFAAIIVQFGKVIGVGCNRVVGCTDPTAHAEIMAIRDACCRTRSFRLPHSILFASSEPCPMCLGAIYWAGIPVVYYAASTAEVDGYGFADRYIYRQVCLPLPLRDVKMTHVTMPEQALPFIRWQLRGGTGY
ncbi:nucleoside deaminase [Mechercharimyces sp. CAU 1602]|uniref:nucleoside deaminase n=1 Tax=Mechercharimyces sp. CAU 1602 TaxID=2973933 RepID=UPI0021625A00|nr:nucleoside deaminase [Mechercharimyces sp. CAU 1602]MCS1352025.1 nucleoside deaminase [Mechercharimyces sp. CAU 1602]